MPTIDRKIKNPGVPGGRNDWKGRIPRCRVSLTDAQLRILIDVMDAYINRYPEKESDSDYQSLLLRLQEHQKDMQKPLMVETVSFPLFDEEINSE